MSYTRTIIAATGALALAVLSGCSHDQAADGSQDLIAGPSANLTVEGEFVSEKGERLIFDSDHLGFAFVLHRQVGRQGGTVPFPTTCTYKEMGILTRIRERTEAERQQYLDYATHEIVWTVKSMTLIDDTSTSHEANGAACPTFLNEQLAAMPYEYKDYAEILSPDHIRMHTSGGGDYTPGHPTPSTLDENFIKVEVPAARE
jgi:hypothetical protein